MRNIWIALFALMLCGFAGPTYAQSTPTPAEVAAICHKCEWIKIQIGDIDEKIAGWQRQIKSLNKYSDLSDPNIQNALKDIDKTIAGLEAKKAALQAQLADCQKRCKEAQQAAPAPVAPGLPGNAPGKPASGGGSDKGGSAQAGGDNPIGGAMPLPPPAPQPDCPKPGGPSIASSSGGDAAGGGKTPRSKETDAPSFGPVDPSTAPPGPKDPDGAEAWNHMLGHIAIAESMFGDDEDVMDAVDDIADAINDAYQDVDDNPDDAGAEARLDWLKNAEDIFRRWKAAIRNNAKAGKIYVVPRLLRSCPPPQIIPRLDSGSKPDSSRDVLKDILGHVSIGIGFGLGGGHGGGRRDNGGRQNGGHTVMPQPPAQQPKTTSPTESRTMPSAPLKTTPGNDMPTLRSEPLTTPGSSEGRAGLFSPGA